MKNKIISNTRNACLLLALLFLLPTCKVNPVTGKKDFMLMSEKQEIRMGQNYDPSVVAQFGLYQDDKMQKFIDEKGQKMASVSHRSHLDFEFKILDSPVVNAFAVPGGYVYFTRGIMAHFNNEAEFAGVLGHEIGHVTARHSAKQYSKSMLAQVGFIVGVVASKQFRQFANEAQQAMGLLFLKFGRDAESESDRLGVEYSTKIGYDAHEMAGFFKTLKRLSAKHGADEIPTFLSTHPDPADRYQKVGELADEWESKVNATNLKVNRNSYLDMVDGLLYGEDPRQGYVENNIFYHPEMLFQYPVPNGWRTVNSPSQVQHGSSEGDAMLMFTLAKGSSLTEASNAFVTENKIAVVNTSETNVGGFSAVKVLGDQTNEQDPNASLRILSYFIKYGSSIYVMHGMTYKSKYNTYKSTFEKTMNGFKKLTDSSKINVKPEKIRVKTVSKTAKLSTILNGYNQASKRLEEIAIINGMELSDTVQKGTKIKILETSGGTSNSNSRTRTSPDPDQSKANSNTRTRTTPDKSRTTTPTKTRTKKDNDNEKKTPNPTRKERGN